MPGKTKAEEIIVIGAHYDSVAHVPGANDNGSGAAAVLALYYFSMKLRLIRHRPSSPIQ
ncbi:M28 family peptidase [Roseofilum reptotaenium]|uniref:M28 family peptidase n=1 Tax=Roseofilum reptotaenium TaxID=1233427 RepID=UPI0036F2DC70